MTIVPSPPIPEPSSVSPAVPQRLTSLESLVRAYLLRFKPATRRAYQGDIQTWLTFCRAVDTDPLTAGMHHVDAYVRMLDELGDPRTGRTLSAASINRRISAAAGFYRYAVRQRAVTESPFFAVEPRAGQIGGVERRLPRLGLACGAGQRRRSGSSAPGPTDRRWPRNLPQLVPLSDSLGGNPHQVPRDHHRRRRHRP